MHVTAKGSKPESEETRQLREAFEKGGITAVQRKVKELDATKAELSDTSALYFGTSGGVIRHLGQVNICPPGKKESEREEVRAC